MITVLLPTRGRPHLLPETIGSLLDNAYQPGQIQICCGIDDDDRETLRAVNRLARNPALDRAFISARYGYAQLHQYVNRMSEVADGDWLFLWNDDALMLTPGWDQHVYHFQPRFILDTWSNHPPETCAFPIVPANWVRAVGHFSLSPHNDTWWQEIGRILCRWVRLDIDVLHNRYDLTGMNNDSTYQEKLEQHRTDEFFSDPMQRRIRRDAYVIRRLLTANRDERITRTWRSAGSGSASSASPVPQSSPTADTTSTDTTSTPPSPNG